MTIKYARALVVAAMVLVGMDGAATEAPAMRADGLHAQPWMKTVDTVRLDAAAAAARTTGKGLVVVFEQPGCPSCKKLHEEIFARHDVVAFITRHFDVAQINIAGEAKIHDFEGAAVSEREFAETAAVRHTPTTVFYGVDGRERFRVPGFIPLVYYRGAFEYALEGGPEKSISFPAWIKANKDRLAAGKGGS